MRPPTADNPAARKERLSNGVTHILSLISFEHAHGSFRWEKGRNHSYLKQTSLTECKLCRGNVKFRHTQSARRELRQNHANYVTDHGIFVRTLPTERRIC